MRNVGRAMVIALTVLTASAAWGTGVHKRGHVRGSVPDLPCAIQVDFASNVSGPDIDAWTVISTYIFNSNEIDDAEVWTWGTEGAFSMCLTIYDAASTPKIFAELTGIAPTVPRKDGGLTTVKLGRLQQKQ